MKKFAQLVVALTVNNLFLLVHQEKWQKELLAKYGNDISLIDATYKTTRYDIALFFICVKTNVGYIPYSLDQTPLLNSRRTSGSAERNSRRSRIVAAPRLLLEHVNVPRD